MPTLDPAALFEVGKRLAPLREQGVLIIGSGFTTHNLRAMTGPGGGTPAWSAEFDDWADHAVGAGDVDALLDFARKAPAARMAHPRTEHWAPLFVSLGATSAEQHRGASAVEGFWWGLSKRSWQFG
jgi:4,5-DOPA dioxygenase extradiol